MPGNERFLHPTLGLCEVIRDEEFERDDGSVPDEACNACAHCLRPSGFFLCGSDQSEFHGGPIDPLGWCPQFSPTTTDLTEDIR